MRNNSNDVRAAEDLVVSVVRSYGVSGCEGDGLPPFTVHGRPAVKDQGCEGPSSETKLGHVLLRHGEPPGCLLPRALQEVEAESVAFVVATANSMPAGPYSFAYIGSWAGEAGPRAVAATQARVAEAAKTIIAVSPARHTGGGRPPGAEAALGAAGVGGGPAADPEPEVVAL